MFKEKLAYYFYRFLQNISFGDIKNFCSFQKHKYAQITGKEIPEIMSYKHNRIVGNIYRNGYDYVPEINNLISYHILNKLKELELKQKIKSGKKIRVCFFLDNVSKFTGQSVYSLMKENPLFEPFILLYNSNDSKFTENDYYYKYMQELECLKKNFSDVLEGYDKNRNYIPIENFYPDIVILNAPALDYSNNIITNEFLNINYLTCYLNYSLNTVNSYDYHYNNRRIASCWKHFVETREDYLELVEYSKFFGLNTVLVGYPKLDSYAKPIEDCTIPNKIDNGNPIVIYAPHCSIREKFEPLNLSTFHIYNKYFLNLLNKYPNVNFVFKPHPFLESAVIRNKIMTKIEYGKYLEKWNNSKNGIVIYDGNYIDLFRKSDLLIQDSGSFIGEWLPTDKPCMYLVNPERNKKTFLYGFSNIGRKILDKYYLCYNLNEIEKYFKMIMFDKQDPLKEERIKLKDEIFINIGCSGQKIVDYLTEILTN